MGENKTIAELKPYQEYKETGLPWLGKVPGHWTINRGKSIFYCIDKRSASGKEELLTVSSTRGVVPRRTASVTMFKAASYAGHKLCWPDDLVINSLWAWAGGLGVAKHHGIISTAYSVYRIRQGANVKAAFIHELLRSSPFQWEFQVRSKGVWTSRLQLTDQSFLDAPIPLPPPSEQSAIVKFLTHATRRLDMAIKAKRKVIALLTEQKRMKIHHILTCGLSTNSPFFSTNNRWFPELPRGWKVLSLHRVIHSAIDGPHFSPQYYDSGIPFLSARNIKIDNWSLHDVKYISEKDYIEFSKRVKPEIGDVLYTKGGTTGVARAVDLTSPFQVWVHVAVLKTIKTRITPEYLAFVLNSPRCYEQSQLFTRGATNQDLGLGRMKEIVFPIPPTIEDQYEIVKQIKTNNQYLDIPLSKISREITLLREYRTRLVSDVVTGKLDVREAAANLPDETLPETVEDIDEPDDETVSSDEEIAV